MEPSNEFTPAIRCRDVIEVCEKQYGLRRGTLREKTKDRKIVSARHVAVYLCRKITGRSYPQIAEAIGYKDHTTCLYACKVAPILLRDPKWAAHAKAIEDEFNA